MSGFLLDTNVVSELRKGSRADAGLRAWLAGHIDDDFWLSVLVTGELSRGVELLARRDAASAAVLGRWLDDTIHEFSDRILPVTLGISQVWAGLSVPDPVPVVDGLLAATALEHGLTLVTRNVADVARTSVLFVNPFAR